MSVELDQDRRDALLERVERRGRQLRRRRRVSRLALGAAMVVVVGGATTGIVLAPGGNSITRVHTQDSTPSSTASSAAGTTSVTPSWLPTGTVLVRHGSVPAPPGLTLVTPPPTSAEYQLPGQANANTFPGGNPDNAPHSLQAIESGLYHPATLLEVSFTSGVTSMPPVPVDPRSFVTQQVRIGGFAAELSYQSNGYGAVRIDWLDPQGYHSVICDRGRTASGTSGLSNADMIRVADSLYT